MVMRLWLAVVLLVSFMTRAQAQQLVIQKCSKADRASITMAVDWIIGNLDEIDLRMGRDGLMPWPNKTRQKFLERLRGYLTRVRCVPDESCADAADDLNLLGDKIPRLNGRWMRLCTGHFNDESHYVALIAHDVARRILRYRKSKSCETRCQVPGFADSVAQAVFSAHKGRYYSPGMCEIECP